MRTDWPHGADVAVSLTFDVDAESGWLGEDPAYANRLSTLSEASYGPTRGLPRILDILSKHEVKATFYVPGDTAERHTEAVKRITDDGHEIGHHGYLHKRSDAIDAGQQREEIERGLEALQTTLDVTPKGYRSPSWELTPETFQLLKEHGFEWDSSLMGDDRPYLHDGLLELPGPLEPRRLAASALEAGPRRCVHRPAGLPRHLAGRVRIGASKSEGT